MNICNFFPLTFIQKQYTETDGQHTAIKQTQNCHTDAINCEELLFPTLKTCLRVLALPEGLTDFNNRHCIDTEVNKTSFMMTKAGDETYSSEVYVDRQLLQKCEDTCLVKKVWVALNKLDMYIAYITFSLMDNGIFGLL